MLCASLAARRKANASRVATPVVPKLKKKSVPHEAPHGEGRKCPDFRTLVPGLYWSNRGGPTGEPLMSRPLNEAGTQMLKITQKIVRARKKVTQTVGNAHFYIFS